MRTMPIAAGVLIALMNASCGGGGGGYGPSEQDITASLQEILRSVSGNWTGMSTVANPISLTFSLTEGGNGQVSGSGTMKEANAAAAVPITITGTFQRPTLSLTFDGMVYESRQVKGTVQGTYTTVGGIGATLVLTAPGYTRDIPVLLQEK